MDSEEEHRSQDDGDGVSSSETSRVIVPMDAVADLAVSSSPGPTVHETLETVPASKSISGTPTVRRASDAEVARPTAIAQWQAPVAETGAALE